MAYLGQFSCSAASCGALRPRQLQVSLQPYATMHARMEAGSTIGHLGQFAVDPGHECTYKYAMHQGYVILIIMSHYAAASACIVCSPACTDCSQGHLIAIAHFESSASENTLGLHRPGRAPSVTAQLGIAMYGGIPPYSLLSNTAALNASSHQCAVGIRGLLSIALNTYSPQPLFGGRRLRFLTAAGF